MARPKTPDHEKLIGRLPDDTRRRILDRLAVRPSLVAVEHSYFRRFESATTTVGTILSVAYSLSGGTSTVLVVRPLDDRLRDVAIPAAHVLRIRAASPWGSTKPGRVRLGEVLAGPPIVRTGETV